MAGCGLDRAGEMPCRDPVNLPQGSNWFHGVPVGPVPRIPPLPPSIQVAPYLGPLDNPQINGLGWPRLQSRTGWKALDPPLRYGCGS